MAPSGGTRPEPSEAERDAERQADRITGKALRGQFKCSDEDFNSIVNEHTFPRCIGYVTGGVLHQRKDTIFSKSEINKYLARQHARAAALPVAVK